jgi:hypothetical protein
MRSAASRGSLPTCAACTASGKSGERPPSASGYYAIAAERRLKHPGVLAITSAARDELFAAPGTQSPRRGGTGNHRAPGSLAMRDG